MPGAPPPPPGLPAFPVPPPEPDLPKELPLDPPIEGDNVGFGAPLEVPEVPDVPPLPVPDVPEVPPIGPVAKVLPVGAFVGLGTVNGDDGFATGVGADTGLTLGLAVGGAGFAGDGLFTAEGVCVVFCELLLCCTFC